MRIVDTHCHLQDGSFDEDRDEARQRALDTLAWFVVIGIQPRDWPRALALTGERVYAAVGFHPYHEGELNDDTLAALRETATHDKVVALGEMGLDYFKHCETPRDVQHAAFHRQLDLAAELNLPVVIHNREADDDCLAILTEHAANLPGVVMHCFGSDAAFADRCVDAGFHISFAGNLTYPKAQALRDAAAAVPADRIMVETDSPYLSPQPKRGKRCEPAFVVHTLVALADTLGMTPEEAAALTTANAERFFRV